MPEAVCRRYPPPRPQAGPVLDRRRPRRRPGAVLVRAPSPPGPPGKWTDAATGEHGDLLDLIGRRIGARSLAPPSTRPAPSSPCRRRGTRRQPGRTRLYPGTAPPPHGACGAPAALSTAPRAEAYLRARGLDACRLPSLRFHPALAYRDDARWRRFPALVAAVTSPGGTLEGVQRTWLHPGRPAKAPVAQPRKALGRVHGHAVRFGAPAGDGAILLVGEGIETVLSLVAAVPALPAAAALSAGSLAALGPRALAARLAPLLGAGTGP